MEYHKVLKEIHLSYCHNITKSRSEYFEYGISHFCKNQPRTTLGFAWKPTAMWGKCHHAANPASLFPQGHEWEPPTPLLMSPDPSLLRQHALKQLPSLARHRGEPRSLLPMLV